MHYNQIIRIDHGSGATGPARPLMESKTARLTVLIDPNKKKAFERLCASQDITPSQVVRQLIRNYLAEHGVSYTRATVGNPRLASPAAAKEPGIKKK
jgi:hypothetical protein